MRPQKTLIALSMAAITLVAMAVPGCGSTPEFDPAVRYSPDSLATELIFRAKSLSSGASKKQIETATKADPAKAAKASEKSREATKAGESLTLDQLVDEIATKAGLVPNKTRSETLKAIVEIVAKDTSLKSEEKQAISEKLGKLANSN